MNSNYDITIVANPRTVAASILSALGDVDFASVPSFEISSESEELLHELLVKVIVPAFHNLHEIRNSNGVENTIGQVLLNFQMAEKAVCEYFERKAKSDE